MSMESMPQENTEAQKPIHERLKFPHLEPILDDFLRESGYDQKANPEVVKDILNGFIEQKLETAAIFTSEKHKAAFPWGKTSTGELAKKLYARYTGKKVGELAPNENPKKKEFVFNSLQSIGGGNQFAFMEEAMHQLFKDLPKALEMIAAGKEPKANEIYILGSPTNELGTMSPEFLEEIKNNKAFDGFGDLYKEFVQSEIAAEEPGNTEIYFYGQSMGASFAAATAELALHENLVTQSKEVAREQNVPFLQIRLDMPVGSSDAPVSRKKWQIPVGFLADGLFTYINDSYAKPLIEGDSRFLGSVREILKERGMEPQLSEEQIALKKQGIKESINSLRAGTPLPKDLKVTKVVGTKDPLMYSPSFNKKAKKQKEEHAGTLGQNLVSSAENEKVFAVDMRHTFPYFRSNELRRLYKATEALESLKLQEHKS